MPRSVGPVASSAMGPFSSPTRCCESCCEFFVRLPTHHPVRRVEHHLSHGFRVCLLVGAEYGPLGPPATGKRHVFDRVALSLRRPLPAQGMPHPTGLAGEAGELVGLPEPAIEQVPAAWLGRIAGGREDGRFTDRPLAPPCRE